METTTNLLWAILAVLAVCAWLRHANARPSRHCTMLRGLLLLSCVLLLLFPWVSASDDIQAGVSDMIEDPTAGGTKLRAQVDALQHVLVAVLPAALPPLPSFSSTVHEIVDTAFRITDADLQPSAPRSPPLA